MTAAARLLTSTEVAVHLGISEHMVRQSYRSGLLPHRKVGRFIRFTADDIDAYVARTAATDTPGGMTRTKAAQNRRRKTA